MLQHNYRYKYGRNLQLLWYYFMLYIFWLKSSYFSSKKPHVYYFLFTHSDIKILSEVEKFPISSHNAWPLLNFCRVWCCAQSLQNGSGTSHVSQKCVALWHTFSFRHGTHNISFLFDSLLLKTENMYLNYLK